MKRTTKLAAGLGMAAILCIGSVTNIQAANTGDAYFNFVINTLDGYFTKGTITSRQKENTSKVYVYITKSPDLYTQVRTWGNRNTSRNYLETVGSPYAVVRRGIKSSITNTIYENRKPGHTSVGCHIDMRTDVSTGRLYGCWSPDSTRNYTVVN